MPSKKKQICPRVALIYLHSLFCPQHCGSVLCTGNKTALFHPSLCLPKQLMLSHHNLADAGRFGKPLGEPCDVTNNYSLLSPLELQEPLKPIKWTRPIDRCRVLPKALAGLALYHAVINVCFTMFFGRKIK